MSVAALQEFAPGALSSCGQSKGVRNLQRAEDIPPAGLRMAKAEGDNPAMKGKMFVAPLPASIPNPPTLATVAASSISASCANPEAAWKFIKFDAGKKWAVQRAKIANWMPLRNDLADEPEIKSDPTLLQFIRIGQNARSYPLPHPVWAEIAANDIVDAVQKALLQPDKTEDIFKDLDTRLTKKLRDI